MLWKMETFILVCWVDDDPIKYSVQSRCDICDGNLRAMPFETLVGMVVDMNWNRRTYKAKIINFGKSYMEFLN